MSVTQDFEELGVIMRDWSGGPVAGKDTMNANVIITACRKRRSRAEAVAPGKDVYSGRVAGGHDGGYKMKTQLVQINKRKAQERGIVNRTPESDSGGSSGTRCSKFGDAALFTPKHVQIDGFIDNYTAPEPRRVDSMHPGADLHFVTPNTGTNFSCSPGIASSAGGNGSRASGPQSGSKYQRFEHDGDGQTTVMIRNIPNVLCQADILDIVDRYGFQGKYNFFYLPIDFNSKANCGYAFLNFFEEEDVDPFMAAFQDVNLHEKSQKKTQCVRAQLQGFLSNIAYYRNSAMNRDVVPEEFKPVIFLPDGTRSKLPEPDQDLRPILPKISRSGGGNVNPNHDHISGHQGGQYRHQQQQGNYNHPPTPGASGGPGGRAAGAMAWVGLSTAGLEEEDTTTNTTSTTRSKAEDSVETTDPPLVQRNTGLHQQQLVQQHHCNVPLGHRAQQGSAPPALPDCYNGNGSCNSGGSNYRGGAGNSCNEQYSGRGGSGTGSQYSASVVATAGVQSLASDSLNSSVNYMGVGSQHHQYQHAGYSREDTEQAASC
eukprot:g15407.t1